MRDAMVIAFYQNNRNPNKDKYIFQLILELRKESMFKLEIPLNFSEKFSELSKNRIFI